MFGDEISSLVADFGTHSVRAGFAGEDTPQAFFRSQVGVNKNEDGSAAGASNAGPSSFLCGDAGLGFQRKHVDIAHVFSGDGLIADWDALEALMVYTFNDALRVQPKEHALLWAEPSYNTREDRERLTELVFEKFESPALFLSKGGVLSAFSCGKASALVIDVGEQTAVTPVHDGYALRKCAVRSPLGGGVLTSEMLRFLQEKRQAFASPNEIATVSDPSLLVRPPYEIKSKREVGGIGSGQWEVITKSADELAGITRSYRDWRVRAVAGDAKETVCQVWKEGAFAAAASEVAQLPGVQYELPDGKVIDVGAERFSIPELLFDPTKLPAESGVSVADLAAIEAAGSVSTMALNAVAKCDVDIRRELLSSVVIVGGSSQLNGFSDRMHRDLLHPSLPDGAPAPPNYRVRLVAPSNTIERRHAAWIGGSILGSLSSFQKMWLSRAEFEEHGRTIVERKCP